jgi:hypothetical protein
MSYKKQQQWYITSQSEHHHTTNPRTKQTHTHQTPPSSTKWERRSKQAAHACAIVTNAVSPQRRNTLQARTAPRAPPPRDNHPRTANTQPSIPPIQRSFSTHSHHNTGDAH